MTTHIKNALLLTAWAAGLHAHPMGNFSVNHYCRIAVGQPATSVTFVLDLAELPSFELLQRWGLQATSPRPELERRATAEARNWVRQLQFTVNGKRVQPTWEKADLVIADGAGGLPVMRVTSHLKLAAKPGTLLYSDGTYPQRTAGWKEVVVTALPGANLQRNSAGGVERSQGLTSYPQDPSVSPPQQLTAEMEWTGQAPAAPVTVSQIEKPQAPASLPVATAATVAEPNSGGQVRRGDFLSQTLQGKEIGWGLGLICVAVAFWFGALHALEPGHGKTMVAAYLVGERGTPKHAVLLGGMVTFTHTVSVFILGLLTMFLSQYIMPDVISKWLGVISGLTIVWIGGLLLYRRARSLSNAAHTHGHGHSHSPGHDHDHAHTHTHTHTHDGHTHTHSHEPHHHEAHVHAPDTNAHSHSHSHSPHAVTHTHTHGGHTHSHTIEGEISMKSLLALGASGGLVPCPSALVLLLAAVSVGRTGFGLLLLVSFSLGLALVLMATGLLVLYAKKFLPERKDRKPHPLTQILPVVSAAVITVIGVVLTGNALGLIPVIRFFG